MLKHIHNLKMRLINRARRYNLETIAGRKLTDEEFEQAINAIDESTQ